METLRRDPCCAAALLALGLLIAGWVSAAAGRFLVSWLRRGDRDRRAS